MLKIVLIFLSIFAISSEKKYSLDFLMQLPPVDFSQASASKSDVIYDFFSNSPIFTQFKLTEESISNHPKINRTLPTKLFVHGYTTDHTSPWYDLLKTEYFKKGPHNIIYINWSKAGSLEYAVSAANVKPVGEFISDFLIASKIQSKKIHLIGHSLGSQLTGYIGKFYYKKTGNKLSRITALDPAKSSFHQIVKNSKLNDADADFVDVIHTDIDYYGYVTPIGHVDFYPNGGKNQPGCSSENDNCNHARSAYFFVESVNRESWKGQKARFLENNKVALEEKPEEILFGDGVPTCARGVYFVKIDKEFS